MVKKKEKGFTLIELIAVLVIMAILALIVTPLVMSIIRKARVSADKRSIDAYGRSIELAVAGYLLDNGSFPTQVSQLTIEYSGPEVVCSTTQLNEDSSVYLAGCTVDGRSVENYTYGKEEVITYDYRVGDEVTYNGVNYRVLKDVKSTENAVTLLKAEPLTVAEVNQYGAGHVNMYVTNDTSASYYQAAYDENGYGGMAYYTSETCGWINNDLVESGCTNAYAQSEVKYVVDAWKNVQAPGASEARLMTYDEFTDNTEVGQECTVSCYDAIVPMYDWMYNSSYWYWLGTPYTDSSSRVRYVYNNGGLGNYGVYDFGGVVRPVIVLSKSVL